MLDILKQYPADSTITISAVFDKIDFKVTNFKLIANANVNFSFTIDSTKEVILTCDILANISMNIEFNDFKVNFLLDKSSIDVVSVTVPTDIINFNTELFATFLKETVKAIITDKTVILNTPIDLSRFIKVVKSTKFIDDIDSTGILIIGDLHEDKAEKSKHFNKKKYSFA